MPKLTYSAGGGERTVEVGDSCSIGRDDNNTVVLDASSGASRRHCQIIKLGAGKYELADLGSTNGTKVNGQTVSRHRLQHGDRIKIGEVVLQYTDPENAPDDDEIDIEDEISLDEPAPRKRGGGGGGGASGDDCYLVYAGGARDGQKVALDKGRVTFGRKSSNTVVIDDNSTSGYHCEVAREGGAYILRDLGSTNGTLLDGEPVTEIPLQHGARIRIGSQRLVFVDPSVKGFEDAMSNMEDLGSEWGLLRAEMDMDRVQKARRSQMVAVVGVFAVVAFAGWFFWSNPDMFREKAATLTAIEGNRIDDFSFEGGGAGWAAAPGSPARARVDKGSAKQGERFLVVSRDGPSGRPAVVEIPGEEGGINVRPGQAYEFGASLKASAGGQGAVRILWEGSSPDGIRRMNATDLVGDGGWTDARMAVTAPGDAKKAHVQLVNAGPGSVSFDDVFLREAQAKPQQVSSESGGITISASADGLVTIRRGADVLIEQAGPTGGVFLTDDDRTDRRGDRAGGMKGVSIQTVEGGVELAGELYLPLQSEFGPVALRITVAGPNLIEVSGNLPEAAALVGGLPKAFVDESVGVFTAGGRSFRMIDTRLAPRSKSVTIGSLKRFRVRGQGGQGEFAFGLLHDADSFEVALAGNSDGFGVQIETDADSLRNEVRQLGESARDAETQKRFGLAVERYLELLGQLTQGSPEAQAAEERVKAMTTAGQARLADLTRDIDEALRFQNVPDLKAGLDAATELVNNYENHPIAKSAEEQRAKAQKGLAAVRGADRESEAAPVLARAQDFLKSGKQALGKAFLRDVMVRFPGTEAAKSAEAQLQQLSGN